MKFSCRRLYLLAALTFQELLHQKVLTLFFFLLLFCLGGALLVASFSFQEKVFLFQEMALGIFSLFLNLLAILLSALQRPSKEEEIMVLARAFPRFEYFFGKLLGIFFLLFVLDGVMGIFFFCFQAIWKIECFDSFLWMALAASLIEAWLLASMTLLISTMTVSVIFNIVTAIAFYFIGHVEATARELSLLAGKGYIMVLGLLRYVGYIIPDLSLFNVNPHAAAAGALGCAHFISVMELGFLYVFIYGVLGAIFFHCQEKR